MASLSSTSSPSPDSSSSSLQPLPQPNKRPVSMSASSPFFVYCPVVPFAPRRASSYSEIGSPPPPPLQQQGFNSRFDPSSYPQDSNHHYLQQQLQQQELQQQELQRPGHGNRRFNESRPIRIPLDLLSISSSPGSKANATAAAAVRSRSSLFRPMAALPKKQFSSSALALSSDKTSASSSSPYIASSSAKRFSSLFTKRSGRNSFTVSILPVGHHSTPADLNLDGSQNADTSSRRHLLAATSQVEDMHEDMNMDVNHYNQSSAPTSSQTPVAVGHATRPQPPLRVQSITLNSNHSNVNLRGGVRTHSSTSSSLHHTSFKSQNLEELQTRFKRTDKNTATNHNSNNASKNVSTNYQREDPGAPTRRKTLLKAVSSSMRQAKKRAADILFGSIRHKSKRTKKSMFDDGAEEGSLATKVDDDDDQDGNYAMSTLSLASTIIPTIALPVSDNLASSSSSFSSPWSSIYPAPNNAAAVATAANLPHPSWSSSPSSNPFARSAENLSRQTMPTYYDFSECTSSLSDSSFQTLKKVEAGAGASPDYRRRRSNSESVVSQMHPPQQASLPPIDNSYTHHLQLHFGLEDVDSGINAVKQKQQGQEEQQKSASSTRFGGLGYREWILSKNRISSFIGRYRKGGGGKKDKKKEGPDAERFTSGVSCSNRSDPYLVLDEQQPAHTAVDSSSFGSSAPRSKKTNKAITRNIHVPATVSSSPLRPSAAVATSSFTPPLIPAKQIVRASSCDIIALQYAVDRRKREQELQLPKPMPFRRVSLSPNTFSPPTSSLQKSVPPTPSIVISSTQDREHLPVPFP
ncbi:MAG: hypothetical protein J3R72DRAFT_489320 [Linnemannia gamsii]|nr:MAG: hypothetical protein J3R72DRAFT_489320 [Linnemannia gamsii]